MAYEGDQWDHMPKDDEDECNESHFSCDLCGRWYKKSHRNWGKMFGEAPGWYCDQCVESCDEKARREK